MRARQQEQTRVLNTLLDKVNVVSGMLGAPPNQTQSVSLWQAPAEAQQEQAQAKIHPQLLEAIQESQELHRRSFARMLAKLDTLQAKVDDPHLGLLQSSCKEIVALITEQVNQVIWSELSKYMPTLQISGKFFLKGGISDFEHHSRNMTLDAVRAAGGMGSRPSMFDLSSDEIAEFKRIAREIEATVQEQQVRLSDLEARSENDSVEIEGHKFTSLSQVAAFVSANGMTGSVLKCLDPIGLPWHKAFRITLRYNTREADQTSTPRAIRRSSIRSSWKLQRL